MQGRFSWRAAASARRIWLTFLGVLVVLASGSLVYAATKPPAPGDFSLAATPSSQTVVPGEAGLYSVSMTPLNGFSGTVSLAVSGLPKSTAATFVSNPLSSSTTSSSLIVETGSSVPTGTYALKVTGTSGSLTHSVTVQMVVASSASFTLDESPTANQGVAPGASTNWTVNIRRAAGFTGSITLATNSDLPSGVTASFSPNPVAGSASTLTLRTSASTPLGSYPFAIQGVSGKTTAWIRGTLNVGTFSVSVVPAAQAISSGGTTSPYSVTLTRSFFTSDVTLSASGLPGGTSAIFSTNPIVGPTGTVSTMTLATSNAVQPGSYPITITATGGTPAQTKTAQVTVQVSALTFSISGTAPSPLYPGAAASPMNLTLTNPNGYSMTITSITVAVASVSAPHATSGFPCSANDFATRSYTSSTGFTLPANSTKTLSDLGVAQSQWPTLGMLDTPTNQDGCKGASLTLSYSGSAHA
jgi:hypothetical protein